MARESPICVLLRRGPARWVRVIKWNISDDTFEGGHWFHGRIYENHCDLIPDGSLLVYFALKFPGRKGYTFSWTAVSRPPWLTALALWPKGDTWGGGGLFKSNQTLWLFHPADQMEPHPDHKPSGLEVLPYPEENGPYDKYRMTRDGWSVAGKFGFSKNDPTGCHQLLQEPAWPRSSGSRSAFLKESRIRCLGSGREISIGLTTWIDWDHRGRLVYAMDGRLFIWQPSEAREFSPFELRDFNNDQPQSIELPPEALTW